MPEIRIPPVLRGDTGGNRTVTVGGQTVRDALDALVREYPALEGRARIGNTVPSYLNVFVDGDDVRLLDGLDTPVATDSIVLLLPAVAGGATNNYLCDCPTPLPVITGERKGAAHTVCARCNRPIRLELPRR